MNAYEVPVWCLCSVKAVFHTWALKRWVLYGALYKCLSFLRCSLCTYENSQTTSKRVLGSNRNSHKTETNRKRPISIATVVCSGLRYSGMQLRSGYGSITSSGCWRHHVVLMYSASGTYVRALLCSNDEWYLFCAVWRDVLMYCSSPAVVPMGGRTSDVMTAR